MAECFFSNLSIFTSRPVKGPAFTVQCPLEMLIIDSFLQILTLGEKPPPMMTLLQVCVSVHVCTCVQYIHVKSVLSGTLTVLTLKDGG